MGDFIGVLIGFAAAIIFLVAGTPLATRIVASDSAFGLRSADTDGDTQIWHLANATIGRDLILTAVAHLLIAVISIVYWGESSIQSAMVVVIIVFSIAGALLALVHGLTTARALGKAKLAFPPSQRRY